tara:strand:+ start:55 stop:324 length:270 start_codon:yes stop_codon:yes gene_type:complete
MSNPLDTLKPVLGITHPMIADMYLKKDFNSKQEENVLIIHARKQLEDDNQSEHDGFDSYLIDLLIDLEELKDKAKRKVGHFDRVDIRTS